MPRLPEHGDNSVHKPDAQTRAGTLYAQLAQQQLLAAAGCQHELGNLVRGSYAAAAALEYAQVSLFPLLFASLLFVFPLLFASLLFASLQQIELQCDMHLQTNM